jgi:DNA-binding MarR family transcriptional regulator
MSLGSSGDLGTEAATRSDEARIARMSVDHVGRIVEQWRAERPDLDFDLMAVLARISRLARLVERTVEQTFARFGLARGGFDVLSALRRSGPPYRLSPSDLYRSFLISSGAMTNRIDRLEEAGLVMRIPDEHDRRAILVGLTTRGHRLIDTAVEAHLANYEQLLAPMSPDQRRKLIELLLELLEPLEAEAPGLAINRPGVDEDS